MYHCYILVVPCVNNFSSFVAGPSKPFRVADVAVREVHHRENFKAHMRAETEVAGAWPSESEYRCSSSVSEMYLLSTDRNRVTGRTVQNKLYVEKSFFACVQRALKFVPRVKKTARKTFQAKHVIYSIICCH